MKHLILFIILPAMYLQVACSSMAGTGEPTRGSIVAEIATAAPTGTRLPSAAAPTSTPTPTTDGPQATIAPTVAGEMSSAVASATADDEPIIAFGRTEEGAYYHGAADAPVTLIDYSDFL
jgi:hypothetical protein